MQSTIPLQYAKIRWLMNLHLHNSGSPEYRGTHLRRVKWIITFLFPVEQFLACIHHNKSTKDTIKVDDDVSFKSLLLLRCLGNKKNNDSIKNIISSGSKLSANDIFELSLILINADI